MKRLKMGCLGVIGLIVLLLVLGKLMGGNDNSSSSSHSSTTQVEQKTDTKQAKEYTSVDAGTMVADLKNNAAAAQKKYKGKDLKVTGKLSNIDSDSKYISIEDPKGSFSMIHIQCFLNSKDKSQEDFVMNLQKGQTVTVYGTISDVGEVLGYSMKVDKFE